jgi:hypothetical protein
VKKILILTLIVASMFAAFGLSAASRIEDGAVNIGATIPVPEEEEGGGGCTSNCGPSVLTVQNVSVVPSCDRSSITWQAFVDGSLTASTSTVSYWSVANPSTITQVEIVTAQTTHTLEILDLIPLAEYDFSITARAQGLSTTYAGQNFTTNCSVTAPAIVVRSATQQALIDITYPNSNDIAGVIVYRGQVVSCPSANEVAYQDATTHTANSTQTVTGNNPSILNQTFGYSVCIFNSYGIYSAPVYGETQRSVPDVSGSSATPGDAQITLAWALPAANSAIDFQSPSARLIRVTSGNCTAATIADGALLSDSASTSFTDTGLQNDQNYQYKIFTKNSYGEYANGVCLSSTPSVVAVARCLANIGSSSGVGSITVNWQNPDDESGFTFNRALWRRGSSCNTSFQAGTLVYQGQDTSFTEGSLTNQLYYYSGFVQYNAGQTLDCGCVVASPSTDEEEEEIEDPIDLCPDCVVNNAGSGGDQLNPNFFVNNGGLEIVARNNQLDILPGYDMRVLLSEAQLSKPVRLIAVQQGRQNYFLTHDLSRNVYETNFMVPATPGEYRLRLSVIYADDSITEREWVLIVTPFGVITQGGIAAGDAQVAIWQEDLFAGYGIVNPQTTGDSGTYGFMVPNGRYTIEVNGTDGAAAKKTVVVANYVINQNIILDPSLIEEVVEVLAPAVAAINQAINNPTVERATEQIAAPVAFIASSVITLSAVPWWNFIYYLQSLFTEPLLWLTRRKRHGWGVVYNSITKQPIDLAVVRLYDSATKRLLQSRVSDRHGRFNFLVEGGSYYLDVSKPGFFFPSELLKNVPEDRQFTDLYYGKPLVIAQGRHGVIVVNIPLDQEVVSLSDQQVLRKHRYQWIRRQASLLGPVFSLIAFAITPGWITGGILFAHVVVFSLFKRLAQKKSPKSWGIIYDKKTKKPLSKAITRIFSPEYNRMLEAYVTDRYGRYGFFAGNNSYYVTADKDGYTQSKTDTIAVDGKNINNIVKHDLGLDPASGAIPIVDVAQPTQSDPVAPETSQEAVTKVVPSLETVTQPLESSSTSTVAATTQTASQSPEIDESETSQTNPVYQLKKDKEDLFG